MGTIGVGLIYLGWAVAAISNIWMVVVAFKESAMWGLGVWLLSCPCYFVFLFKFWDEAKKPFFANLAGLGLIFAGVGVAAGSHGTLGDRPAEVSTWTEVDDPSRPFTFEVPSSWTTEPQSSEEILVLKNASRATYLITADFSRDVPPSYDLEDAASIPFESTTGAEPDPGDLVSLTTKSGLTGLSFEFVKDGQKSINAVFEIGGAFYLAQCRGSKEFAAQDRPVFDRVLQSFSVRASAGGAADAGGDAEEGADGDLPDWAKKAQAEAQAEAPEVELTEDVLLQRIATSGGDRMLEALQEWRNRHFERGDGARFQVFKALKGAFPPDALRIMRKSLDELPLKTDEALLCMQLETALPDSLRRPILRQLARSEDSRADAVAAALAEAPDTGDLLIEEVLVRVGRPRDGAATKLLGARGVDWGKGEAGRELLGRLASDLAQLEPLLKSSDAERRALACDLLVGGEDARGTLKLLSACLRDDEKEVRRRAALAMGERRDARASLYLALALTREKAKSLLSVYKSTLQRLPKGETLGFINKLYRKDSSRARLGAVMAARALKSPKTVPLLMTAAKDPNKTVALAALSGLQGMCRHTEYKRQMAPSAQSLEDLAKSSKDPEVSRLAGRVFFAVTGRVVRK